MKKISVLARLLAFSLILCLIFGIAPAMPTVAAAATAGTITVTPTDGSAITLSETATTATVGIGRIVYDVAKAKITLDQVAAKKIVFAMNGDFTLELLGENTLTDSGTTRELFSVTSGNITVIGPGSLTVEGAATQTLAVISGDMTVAGGSVKILGESCANTFKGTGNLTVSGGELTVRGTQEVLRWQGTGKKMTVTGGKVDVTAISASNAIYVSSIDISGGTVNSTALVGGYAIRSSEGDVKISGGTVNASAAGSHAMRSAGNTAISGGNVNVSAGGTNGYGIYAGKNLTISQPDETVPTNLHVEADYAFAIYPGGTTFSVTGGRITGSGNNFFYSSKAMTAVIGSDAVIDFDAAVAPLKGDTVTVQAEGIWDSDQGLANTTTPSAVKTTKQRPVVNATLSATATMNGAAQAGVTVTLSQAGTAVGTAVTDANGAVSFALKNLTAGDTYVYTLKQTAADATSHYDLEEKTVSVFVDAAGTVSVTGDREFKNITGDAYITVTTDGGSKPLFDLAGDDTPTTVTAGNGTVSYDGDTGTVILNNVSAKSINLDLKRDFTLQIEGENILGNSTTERIINIKSGNVTVTGTGKAYLVAKRYAVAVVGNYTQIGAFIDANAVGGTYSLLSNGNISFLGGTFDGYATSYYGIRTTDGSITISNATVSSVATANSIMASGTDLIVNSGTVTVIAHATASEDGNCALRAARDMYLGGGTVSSSSDERAVSAGGKLTVTPSVKLTLQILNSSASRRYVYGTLEDTGVVYMVDQSFAANGLKVETLVGNEAEELASQLTESVNAALDGMTVSNSLTVDDVKAALADVPASFTVALTDHVKATDAAPGSFRVSVTLGDLVNVSRTLVIEQLPSVSGIVYDFATAEAGIAQGTVTVTLSKDYAAGKYDLSLRWGTAAGPLTGYKALSNANRQTIDGATVSYGLDARTAIPLGVTHLWVVIDGEHAESYEIPAARRSDFGAQKYTFGILSDTHFGYSAAPDSFTNALTYLESVGAKFVTVAGDFTSHGSQTEYNKFKETYEGKFSIPLFTTLGNHDALDWVISEGLTTETAVANMLANMETFANPDYTGPNGEFTVEVSPYYGGRYDYTVQYGDDLFVYLGIGPNEIEEGIANTDSTKYNGTAYVTENQLTWLEGVLADSDEYQNVILMFHYPTKASGIPLYKAAEAFRELSDVLKGHDNVIHLSGHTHYSFESTAMPFSLSQTEKYAWNGTEFVESQGDLGYTAVHVPSLYDKQIGYVVTVYEKGILLTGYDFAAGEAIPYATYFVANESADDSIKSENKDLSVNYHDVSASGTVYSLDLVWENDDVTFNYVAGEQGAWNPADHTFSETANAGWEDDDLKVTVVNHSNAPVTASVEISDADADDGLSVTSDKAAETLPTAEGTSYGNAPKADFILTVTGTPEAAVTKVATATVSFAKPK